MSVCASLWEAAGGYKHCASPQVAGTPELAEPAFARLLYIGEYSLPGRTALRRVLANLLASIVLLFAGIAPALAQPRGLDAPNIAAASDLRLALTEIVASFKRD